MIFLRMLLTGLLTLAAIACEQDTLNIGIKYSDLHGLQKQDRILLENEAVGKIVDIIDGSGGDYIVQVAISGKIKDKLTDKTKFYIINDPKVNHHKAIKAVPVPEGNPLHDGSVVRGIEDSQLIVQDLFDSLGKGIEELGTQVEDFLKGLQQIPESDEYQKLKKELEQLGKQLKEAEEETREKIQKEIIPKIEQELERLKEELRKFGKEKDVEPLEKELNNLRKI